MAVSNDEYRERTPLDDAFVQKMGPKVPVTPADLFGPVSPVQAAIDSGAVLHLDEVDPPVCVVCGAVIMPTEYGWTDTDGLQVTDHRHGVWLTLEERERVDYDSAAEEAANADFDFDMEQEAKTGFALCPECGCYAMKTYVRATRQYGGGWDTGGTCHYCGYKEANV
jgi:hypothetical protein